MYSVPQTDLGTADTIAIMMPVSTVEVCLQFVPAHRYSPQQCPMANTPQQSEQNLQTRSPRWFRWYSTKPSDIHA